MENQATPGNNRLNSKKMKVPIFVPMSREIRGLFFKIMLEGSEHFANNASRAWISLGSFGRTILLSLRIHTDYEMLCLRGKIRNCFSKLL